MPANASPAVDLEEVLLETDQDANKGAPAPVASAVPRAVRVEREDCKRMVKCPHCKGSVVAALWDCCPWCAGALSRG